MSDASRVLTDSFGRGHTYLRIALTERCNLRCTYCMPADGLLLRPRSEMMTFEEIIRLSRLFASQGVNKIRLTGGEPLVRKDLKDLTTRLAAIPGIDTLAITTNGLLLEKKLPELQKAGVTLFNISLDTLRADRFEEITRRPGLERVLGAIHASIDAGYRPVKVNCVVQRNVNADEIVDFVALTKDLPIEVRFIEYMPFDGNGWNDNIFLPWDEMMALIRPEYPDIEALATTANETSKTFRVPGHVGTVGFITSMSANFCGSCNRIRLTADGNLKVCLFSNAELSLRDLMRQGVTDEDLLPHIQQAVFGKKAAHGGMHKIAETPNRPMILIGG